MNRASVTASLAVLLALGGCAGSALNSVPPSAPGVVAVPANGKGLPVFQQEDAACRAYAAQQIAGPPIPNNGYTPGTTLQQRYDIAYTQCMYSKGNTVLSSANFTGGLRVAEADYDAYPYYGVLLGSSVFVGSGGFRQGHGFHHGWDGGHANWASAHGWAAGHGWGHGWSGHGPAGRGPGGGRGSAVAHGGTPSGAGHGSGHG